MKQLVIILVSILFLWSCSKEDEIAVHEPIYPVYWKKYVGDYKVYNTLGVFMYDMNIFHTQSEEPSGIQPNDSLTIINFADTFDLTFKFTTSYVDLTDQQEYLNIRFHDSIKDYNDKTWRVESAFFDTTTLANENSLINDTMLMYFVMHNGQFYIDEVQPYFYCKCKQVAVKQ